MKNQTTIDYEIEKLETIMPRVTPFSFFGDSHHRAIQAQIDVLKNRYTLSQTDDRYCFAPDNVRDSATTAACWLHDDNTYDFPESIADEWEELCR